MELRVLYTVSMVGTRQQRPTARRSTYTRQHVKTCSEWD